MEWSIGAILILLLGNVIMGYRELSPRHLTHHRYSTQLWTQMLGSKDCFNAHRHCVDVVLILSGVAYLRLLAAFVFKHLRFQLSGRYWSCSRCISHSLWSEPGILSCRCLSLLADSSCNLVLLLFLCAELRRAPSRWWWCQLFDHGVHASNANMVWLLFLTSGFSYPLASHCTIRSLSLVSLPRASGTWVLIGRKWFCIMDIITCCLRCFVIVGFLSGAINFFRNP